MIYYPDKCFKTYKALSYFLMSVLMSAKLVHTIIQMNCMKSFQSNNLIKLGYNTIQIIYNIIQC